eukprot:4849889-Amphidinium_carterae.1
MKELRFPMFELGYKREGNNMDENVLHEVRNPPSLSKASKVESVVRDMHVDHLEKVSQLPQGERIPVTLHG